jgi:hypothetical protein
VDGMFSNEMQWLCVCLGGSTVVVLCYGVGGLFEMHSS